MRSRFRFAALLLAVWLAPAAVLADVSDADRATARTLAVEGQAALDRSDYQVALDRFSRADALIHAPTLLIGVARAQAGLGRLLAAQESYSRIVREGVAEGSPDPFFVALESARKELEALAPRVPSVTIQVKGPADAQVTIDGEAVPAAALGARRPVDPGTRVIRATPPGGAPVEQKVTVAEGVHETVTFELKALTAPPPPSGSATAPPPVVPPGGDQAGGGFDRTTLGIAALGVGGAGLILGAVTGILAIGKHSDLEAACTGGVCGPQQQGDLDSYHTLGTLSTIGFIAGGVGAAAGVFLILTAPEPPPRGAFIRPFIAPGYVGAGGRF